MKVSSAVNRISCLKSGVNDAKKLEKKERKKEIKDVVSAERKCEDQIANETHHNHTNLALSISSAFAGSAAGCAACCSR